MDSVTVFNNLLKTIETSNLNYCMNKTPYSARISIKSTFVNRLGNLKIEKSDQLKSNSQEEKIIRLQSELLNLRQENIELNDILNEERDRFKVLNKSIIETFEENSDKSNLMCKNKKLEEAFHATKMNYEQEISDHEITVKEKNVAMNEIMKKEKLINQFKADLKNLEQEIDSAEKKDKSSSKALKTKEKEFYEIKKENTKIKEDLDRVKVELVKFKTTANQEKKELERKFKKTEKKDFLNNMKSASNQADTFNCGHCGEKFGSKDMLRNHIKIHHEQTSSTQTDEISLEMKSVQCELDRNKLVQKKDAEQNVTEEAFVNAPNEPVVKKASSLSCNPCGKYFFSEISVKEHKQVCQGKQTFSTVQNPLTFLPVGFSSTPFSTWLPPPHPK